MEAFFSGSLSRASTMASGSRAGRTVSLEEDSLTLVFLALEPSSVIWGTVQVRLYNALETACIQSISMQSITKHLPRCLSGVPERERERTRLCFLPVSPRRSGEREGVRDSLTGEDKRAARLSSARALLGERERERGRWARLSPLRGIFGPTGMIWWTAQTLAFLWLKRCKSPTMKNAPHERPQPRASS